MRKMRIFGDSIMKRIVYNEAENRYKTLPFENVLQVCRRLGMEVRDNTMFGCTVVKGMQLLKRAIDKGLSCDYTILEFGGNDCDFEWKEIADQPESDHESRTPLPVFTDTLRSMIELLHTHHVEPLLMTLPPIDSERYLEHICRDGLNKKAILSWLTDIQVIERYQELYSLQIAKIAMETNTRLIDIRSGFLARKDCASLICKDGIHPNEKGHGLILDMLVDYRKHQVSA